MLSLEALSAREEVRQVIYRHFRAADRLDVTGGIGADPNVGPRRRNREKADTLQRGRVAHRVAVRIAVVERARLTLAPDARIVVVDIDQVVAGGELEADVEGHGDPTRVTGGSPTC